MTGIQLLFDILIGASYQDACEAKSIDDNTVELISSGLCNINDAIGSREDVMKYLIRKGIEPIKFVYYQYNPL